MLPPSPPQEGTAELTLFDYEDAAIRGALNEQERAAVIRAYAEYLEVETVADSLNLPRDLVQTIIGDPLAAEEIVQLIRNTESIRFMADGLRSLREVVRRGADSDRIAAAKLLAEILGVVPERTPRGPKKAAKLSAPVSTIEALVRKRVR